MGLFIGFQEYAVHLADAKKRLEMDAKRLEGKRVRIFEGNKYGSGFDTTVTVEQVIFTPEFLHGADYPEFVISDGVNKIAIHRDTAITILVY